MISLRSLWLAALLAILMVAGPARPALAGVGATSVSASVTTPGDATVLTFTHETDKTPNDEDRITADAVITVQLPTGFTFPTSPTVQFTDVSTALGAPDVTADAKKTFTDFPAIVTSVDNAAAGGPKLVFQPPAGADSGNTGSTESFVYTFTVNAINPLLGGIYTEEFTVKIVSNLGDVGGNDRLDIGPNAATTDVRIEQAKANSIFLSATTGAAAGGSVFATYRGNPLTAATPVVWRLSGAAAVFSSQQTSVISTDATGATSEFNDVITFERKKVNGLLGIDFLNTQQIIFLGESGTVTVTVESQGFISFATITITPGGGIPASIEPPTGAIRLAHDDQTGETLTFVVRNAQGGFVPVGTRFSASLVGTGFLGTTSGACDTASNSNPSMLCTGTVGSSGVALVRVFGVGVTGSATLTVGATSVTASVAIIFFGSVASVEVVIADRLPLNDGSAAHSVQAIVLDDRGTEVTGQTVTFSFVETVAAGTSLTNVTVTDGGAEDLTAVGGSADADDGDVNTHFIVGAGEQLGTVVTISAAVGEVSGTASFTVAGEAAFVIVEIAADLVLIRTASLLTVTAVDETGAPARDGATVRVSATFGALAGCDQVLNDGVATCTFLAPSTAQTGAIVASVGEDASAASGLLQLTVAVNAPASGIAKTLPAPPAGGLTIGISGTTEPAALVAAQRFEIASVSVFDFATQSWLVYLPGAPAIVNTLTGRLTAESIVMIRRPS